MGLADFKFKEADFAGKKIADLSDTPSSDGMGAAELKAYFDYIPKAMIALGVINGIIDELGSTAGAGSIGAAVNEVTGIDVQTILSSLKTLIDDRYTKSTVDNLLDGKASTTTVSGMIASVDFDTQTGVFTFTEQGGTVHTFDTALEQVVTNWDYDEQTQKLVLTLESGETKNIDLSAFVTINEFLNSDTIDFSVNGAKVTANIKQGSITDSMFESSLLAAIQAYAQSCQSNAQTASAAASNAGSYSDAAGTAATAAGNSERSAAGFASSAATDARNANSSAITAQSYAVGGTGTRQGEDTDNAKYYYQMAKEVVGEDFVTRSELTTALDDKVDKEAGKDLSTNDYNNTDKGKVDNLPANTNTALAGKVDKIAGKGLSTNDYTTTEKNKVANLPANTNAELNKKANTSDVYSKTDADGRFAKTVTYTATVGTAWTAKTGYVQQTITVNGILATDNPIIDLVTSTADFAAQQEAWGKVFKVTTAANSITLYASEATTTAISIQLKVVR